MSLKDRGADIPEEALNTLRERLAQLDPYLTYDEVLSAKDLDNICQIFKELAIPLIEKRAREEIIQKLSGYFRDDGELHKTVFGALRDMANVHGEINSKNLSSAAKRITHQIASYIKDKKKWQALKSAGE